MSENNNNAHESDLLWGELFGVCMSDYLSEDSLREIFERHGMTPKHILDTKDVALYLLACADEVLDEGIIHCLIEYFPAAAGGVHQGLVALHVALANKNTYHTRYYSTPR